MPGPSSTELWLLPTDNPPQKLELPIPRPSSRLIAALHTRSLLALPLWIAPDGNPTELVSLELTSRHLARKGHPTHAIIIHADPDRKLVLGILPSDDDSFDQLALEAKSFEAPARLLDPQNADLLLWREDHTICFALFRSKKCAYFSSTAESSLTSECAATIARCAIRLEAEDIIPNLPAKALLIGEFSPAEHSNLKNFLNIEITTSPTPPLKLPDTPADLPPPAAITLRLNKAHQKRLKSLAILLGSFYLAILAILTTLYTQKALTARSLASEATLLKPKADTARQNVTLWRVIRPAVDPNSFALDQLAAIARALPGDSVRLTQVVSSPEGIIVSGEAADVSQTYQMLEKIKSEQIFTDFDWTARQPEIAGRNTIRFEFEAKRPHASSLPQ